MVKHGSFQCHLCLWSQNLNKSCSNRVMLSSKVENMKCREQFERYKDTLSLYLRLVHKPLEDNVTTLCRSCSKKLSTFALAFCDLCDVARIDPNEETCPPQTAEVPDPAPDPMPVPDEIHVQPGVPPDTIGKPSDAWSV